MKRIHSTRKVRLNDQVDFEDISFASLLSHSGVTNSHSSSKHSFFVHHQQQQQYKYHLTLPIICFCFFQFLIKFIIALYTKDACIAYNIVFWMCVYGKCLNNCVFSKYFKCFSCKKQKAPNGWLYLALGGTQRMSLLD